MQRPNKGIRKNYARRGIGILLFLLPFALIACSLRGRPFHFGKALIPALGGSVGLMVVALLLSSLNLYLSFVRPALFRHRPDYRFVSGIPVIGTLLVMAGTAVGWSAALPGLLGFIALLLDTEGLPWLIIATWSDASCWDS
jgi:hypothetical protein